MRIVSLISRQWSYEITKKIVDNYKSKIKFLILAKKYIKINKGINKLVHFEGKFSVKHLKMVESFSPDLILAYGWSDYISENLRKIAPCLILHPSKLPKYRGGSPIQNQILDGQTKSAVSILIAEDKLDTGDIIFQEEISFKGYLNDILGRMVSKGIKGTKKILKVKNFNSLKKIKQDNKKATYRKRRKPAQSRINIKDITKFNAEHFYNLVRGLQDPYPLAYIECKGKSRLYLKEVFFDKIKNGKKNS